MTADERLDRIEHITAAIAEERRKDREEYKTLWRDTQRQINELASGMVGLRQHVDELAVETRLRIQDVNDRLGDRISQLANESRAADQALSDRIASLVPAMGEFIARR